MRIRHVCLALSVFLVVVLSGLPVRSHAQVCAGTTVLNSQAAVDAFVTAYGGTGCHTIDGNLSIQGSWNLTGLSFLTTVNGLFSVSAPNAVVNFSGLLNITHAGALRISVNNATIPVLGLTSIGGGIEVITCQSLTSFNFVNAVVLDTVHGDLSINTCAALTAIPSLANLVRVDGTLKLRNTGLTQINAISDIAYAGNFELTNNTLMTNVQITGDLEVAGNFSINLPALTTLNLAGVERVGGTLSLGGGLTTLNAFNGSAPQVIHNLQLSCFSITNFSNITTIDSLHSLSFYSKTSVLPNLSNFTELEALTLNNMPYLADLSALATLPAFSGRLQIDNCDLIQDLAPLNGTTQLEFLKIESCEGLTSLSGLQDLSSLGALELSHCPGLTSLGTLSNLVSLDTCRIHWCDSLLSLSALSNVTTMSVLEIHNCNSIETLGLANLSEVDLLSIQNCPSLTALDDLSNLSTVGNLILYSNSQLNMCCALHDVQIAQPDIADNGPDCSDWSYILQECIDLDGDGVVELYDNCPGMSNPGQQDTDGDGTGDACDDCPVAIDLEFYSQDEIDDFWSDPANYEGCFINSIYIEAEDAVDLSGFSLITEVQGDFSILEIPILQSLHGLENLRYVGGDLFIHLGEVLVDISSLSGLDSIGGDFIISNAELLQSLDAVSQLLSVGGTIDVQYNTELWDCCSLYPFITMEKPSAGVILSENAPLCMHLDSLAVYCVDSDNDGIPNLYDNCPLVFNPQQFDLDNDGAGNLCDNCTTVYNPDQANQDGDARGDACDNCPLVASGFVQDSDGDGIGNPCESIGGATSGFTSVGTATPKSRLHVAEGDVYVTNVHRGIVLQAPDGSCYRIRVLSDGSLQTRKILCP